jgi:hypothetical protein
LALVTQRNSEQGGSEDTHEDTHAGELNIAGAAIAILT